MIGLRDRISEQNEELQERKKMVVEA